MWCRSLGWYSLDRVHRLGRQRSGQRAGRAKVHPTKHRGTAERERGARRRSYTRGREVGPSLTITIPQPNDPHVRIRLCHVVGFASWVRGRSLGSGAPLGARRARAKMPGLRTPEGAQASASAVSTLLTMGTIRWLDSSRASLARRKYQSHTAEQGIEGDQSLNCDRAFRIRQQLKREPSIEKSLDEWWNVALLTALGNGRSNASTLRFQDYRFIYRVLYMELLGDESYDEAEADASAEEEFAAEADTPNRFEMSGTAFKNAMFELCDLHVPSLRPAEYTSFLDGLLAKLPRSADGSLLPVPAMAEVKAAIAARAEPEAAQPAQIKGKRQKSSRGVASPAPGSPQVQSSVANAGVSALPPSYTTSPKTTGEARASPTFSTSSMPSSQDDSAAPGSAAAAADPTRRHSSKARPVFGSSQEPAVLTAHPDHLEVRYVDGSVCRALFLPWEIPDLRGSMGSPISEMPWRYAGGHASLEYIFVAMDWGKREELPGWTMPETWKAASTLRSSPGWSPGRHVEHPSPMTPSMLWHPAASRSPTAWHIDAHMPSQGVAVATNALPTNVPLGEICTIRVGTRTMAFRNFNDRSLVPDDELDPKVETFEDDTQSKSLFELHTIVSRRAQRTAAGLGTPLPGTPHLPTSFSDGSLSSLRRDLPSRLSTSTRRDSPPPRSPHSQLSMSMQRDSLGLSASTSRLGQRPSQKILSRSEDISRTLQHIQLTSPTSPLRIQDTVRQPLWMRRDGAGLPARASPVAKPPPPPLALLPVEYGTVVQQRRNRVVRMNRRPPGVLLHGLGGRSAANSYM